MKFRVCNGNQTVIDSTRINDGSTTNTTKLVTTRPAPYIRATK